MKLYVICGHGAGDPGACSGGYSEAERVRALAKRMKALGGSSVVILDTSVNWYASKKVNAALKKKVGDNPVVEMHQDSASESAKGGHVVIKSGLSADKHDKALAKFIGDYFPGRSVTISKRSDLQNPNMAADYGINYRLLEVCFISNKSDREKFNKNMDKVATGILGAFGIKASKETTSKTTASKTTTSSTGSFKAYKVKVTATALNVRKGAGTNYEIVKQSGKNLTLKKGDVYTITAEKKNGSTKWGKLKSGAGWISLAYTKKV